MTEPHDPRLPSGYYYMVPIQPPRPPRRVPIWAIVGFIVTIIGTAAMFASILLD